MPSAHLPVLTEAEVCPTARRTTGEGPLTTVVGGGITSLIAGPAIEAPT